MMKWVITFLALAGSALLLPSAHADIILVDFGYGDPGPEWNVMYPAFPPSPDLHFTSGLDSGIDLFLSSQFSGVTGPAGAFTNTAPWVETAADDGLISSDWDVTITLQNVDPSLSLTLKLVSSSSEQDFYGYYRVNGNFADNNPSGNPFSSQIDGYQQGTVMVWSNMTADVSGNVTFTFSKYSAGNYYNAANALRITVIPEPSVAILVTMGGTLLVILNNKKSRTIASTVLGTRCAASKSGEA